MKKIYQLIVLSMVTISYTAHAQEKGAVIQKGNTFTSGTVLAMNSPANKRLQAVSVVADISVSGKVADEKGAKLLFCHFLPSLISATEIVPIVGTSNP